MRKKVEFKLEFVEIQEYLIMKKIFIEISCSYKFKSTKIQRNSIIIRLCGVWRKDREKTL